MTLHWFEKLVHTSPVSGTGTAELDKSEQLCKVVWQQKPDLTSDLGSLWLTVLPYVDFLGADYSVLDLRRAGPPAYLPVEDYCVWFANQ